MESFQGVLTAFQIGLQPMNMLFCFIGVLLGTLIGVLPGLGPTATISLLLPITFKMTPTESIIMLSGIYYGALYGGSTTSILVNIPGEPASVVTCLDGYQMAKKGRAGQALSISAIGSFIAGTIGVVGLMLLAPPLAAASLRIGPPEYFSLLCAGFTLVIYLSSGSIPRALMMAACGIILGCVGQDPETGTPRYCLSLELYSGIPIVPIAMGLFGIAEVFANLEIATKKQEIIKTNLRDLILKWQDWKDSAMPIMRATILGFFLGIIPGGGGLIASFASYAIEKKLSKYPEKFGTGVIEGVAGPESANNSATAGAFIPLLTLGIPSNVVMAILLASLVIHGVVPGPFLMQKNPEIFWGVIGSMYVGNLMLLVLNLPLIGVWVKILKIPYRTLFPLIILFCLIGSYSLNNSVFDISLMLFFGVVGYLMRKFKYEPAPMIFALVLAPTFESSLRHSLLLSDGSPLIFFNRPIAAIGMVLTIVMLVSVCVPFIRRRWKSVPKT